MKKIEDKMLLVLLLGLYSYISIKHFWIYPAPSDQLEYIQSIHWGTSVGGYWPWLDRVGLGAILGIIGWFPMVAYKAAPLFAFLVSLLSLTLGSFWLLSKQGFGAALYFLTLMISSYYVYHFATEIFPEPSIILFLLVTTLCLMSPWKKYLPHQLFLAGASLSIAALCKIVVLPISGLIALYVLYNHQYMNRWRFFFAGVLSGLALIFFLFISTYGWASWVDMFIQFYEWNFKFMLKGNPGVNNIVSYYELFVHRGYLPVFIALFISLGVYRQRESRVLVSIAWLLGGTICFVYLIGDRPGSTIANYMYPMFFFAALALSHYWGSFLQLKTVTGRRVATLLVFLSLLAGWTLGSPHNTASYFEVGLYRKATFAIKSLLVLSTFALALIPTWIELYQKKWTVYISLLVIGFFSMLYNGGRAKTVFAENLIPEVEYYYNNAPLLNLIPSDDFVIYNSHWKGQARAQRIITVYTHFFNEKFTIPHTPERQKYAMDHIYNKISVVRKLKTLAGTQKTTIVTDLVDEVLTLFPTAEITGSVPWKGYQLSILTIPKE